MFNKQVFNKEEFVDFLNYLNYDYKIYQTEDYFICSLPCVTNVVLSKLNCGYVITPSFRYSGLIDIQISL